MGQKYQVARGGSILTPAKPVAVLLKAGTVVEADKPTRLPNGEDAPALSKKQVRKAVEDGYLTPFNGKDEQVVKADDLTDNPPGRDREPVVFETGDENKDQSVKITNPGGVKVETLPADPAAKAEQVQSPWTLDPEDLAEKSIDELNVMVAERDDSIEPFDTEQEAIAFLSRDRDDHVSRGVVTKGGEDKDKSKNRVATAAA